MSTPDNMDRSAWAEAALDSFVEVTHSLPYSYQSLPDSDRTDTIGDLLCDLMHLCNQEGHDFKSLLARAEYHYNHEIEETLT